MSQAPLAISIIEALLVIVLFAERARLRRSLRLAVQGRESSYRVAQQLREERDQARAFSRTLIAQRDAAQQAADRAKARERLPEPPAMHPHNYPGGMGEPLEPL